MPAWCDKKTHRRVQRKLTLVFNPKSLGCNEGVGVSCTPKAFQRFFVKYVSRFDAQLLGWNKGRVFLNSGIFQTSWVKPAPYACQHKKKGAKSMLRKFLEFGAAADEVENRPQVTSVELYFVRVRISPYKPP
jgi:hypothetical protein